MARVLLSPLNWGLGHAMRDIPIIRTLLDHGHEVTIAAYGNALMALQREFPSCRFIEFEDYPSPYSAGRFFLPKLSAYFPVLLRAVARERREIERILSRDRYDLVISDNRLGVYSSKVPSLFITHQLHFHLPPALWPVELFASVLNRFHHGKFDRIIVPDNPHGPLSLAGKLSRPDSDSARSRAFFAGILTSTPKRDVPADLDYLVLISGPEPQRTRLEEILLPQATELDGKSVVLLGSPQKNLFGNRERGLFDQDVCLQRGEGSPHEPGKVHHLPVGLHHDDGTGRAWQEGRPLYPYARPDQQEYLSWYYEKNGWFFSKSQYHLDLSRDISTARKYHGFPAMPSTEENVRRLYRDLLAGYLDDRPLVMLRRPDAFKERNSQWSFMDDLILAGALSITGLYAAAVITVAAALFAVVEILNAAAAGDPGRVVVILGIILLVLSAYAGTGLWLQKSGRI